MYVPIHLALYHNIGSVPSAEVRLTDLQLPRPFCQKLVSYLPASRLLGQKLRQQGPLNI